MARNMICKTSPSIVLPLALSAIGTNPSILNPTISSSSRQRDGSLGQSHFFSSSSRQRDGSLGQSHSFSSEASGMDSVNASLYKLLKNEMKSVKSNLNNSKVSTFPDSFPYKIVDDPHQLHHRKLKLQRKFLADVAETITLIINMVDVDKKEYLSSNVINGEDDRSKKDTKAPAIPMIVRVRKQGAYEHFNFKITVSTKDIVIQSFNIGTFEVPKFKELNNEVQRSLYKYLEIRGIESSIARSLLEYMAVESNMYNLQVLKDLMEFIEI